MTPLSIATGLFVLLLVALEAGFRLGRRASGEAASAGGQVGAVQGAVLGLLGLLLAFSFSAAASRFLERQDLIVTEANAIGTAYLRADLLDEPHASALRDALKRYAEHRIEASKRLRSDVTSSVVAEVDRLHAEMWRAAIAGVEARPGSMLGVLPPINEVIDLHSTRLAAGRKHIPLLVMALLVACSMLALGVIGYGSGLGGRRRLPLTLSLTILIGAALWITIDLDHPRAGAMQVSDAPLEALRFDAAP